MPHKPPNPVHHLSPDLRPIYDIECSLGNSVAGIAEPAGTECPFAVYFRDPLHFENIERDLRLPGTVTRWECDDPHYDKKAGYACQRTRHCVAGPLPTAD